MREEITSEVLSRIKPSKAEREALKRFSSMIIKRIDETAKELGINARGLLVGSAARSTWLRGDKDLDIFILLPENLDTGEFEEKGIKIARGVADEFEERYAEHAYIKAFFGDYEVDLVPCFAVANPSRIKSAVDRTPFHNEFVLEHIKGREDEVLLLKQFMKGISTYGAELKTCGFSGYLCELLIIKYGSFLATLKAAKDWKHGVKISLDSSSAQKFDDPLIVIDPVDSGRNVAAAVSTEKFYKFISGAREYLEKPAIDFFFPESEKPLSKEEFLVQLRKRGTAFNAVLMNSPDVVEDVLYPQLRKAMQSILAMLDSHEFRVFKSDVFGDSKQSIILLEFSVWKLPQVKKHLGPPVEEEEHAKKFLAKYTGNPSALSRPYIQGDRYMVEVPRKYTEAADLLKDKVKSCALGKHLSESAKQGYEVLENEEIKEIEGEQFWIFLKDFLKI